MVEDETWVICPHCLQRQMLYVDPSTEGDMVQDCDVCCHPWTVHVERDERGQPTVTIDRI